MNNHIDNNIEDNKKIASYVFSGSNTMVGVCITVITLFRVMKTGLQTYADEILAFDISVFIMASILSYAVLRKAENKRLEKWADIFYYTGMIIMFFVGLIIIYTTY
jgi:uncharacterized membrane protein